MGLQAHLEYMKDRRIYMNGVEIFLSYCQKDSNIADDICNYFKTKNGINLHRDIIDIGSWKSIREFMKTIRTADYAILLISDSYLKSSNCMFEVLEVMKDIQYQDKIFPAVIENSIYDPIGRVEYVKYWQDQAEKMEKALQKIKTQNLGELTKDLKRMQDISSNIVEFMSIVSDMNNPNIKDISTIIENILTEKGLIGKKNFVDNKSDDLFSTLGITVHSLETEPTEFEINKFTKKSFKEIVSLLTKLCNHYQDRNSNVDISVESVDRKNVIFQFYKNGKLVRTVKLFLNSMFGDVEKICISLDCSLGSNNSWNEMYMVESIEGELKFKATMSLWGQSDIMGINEVVKDIWTNYIQLYVER